LFYRIGVADVFLFQAKVVLGEMEEERVFFIYMLL
jgi:hypothetical protein